MIKISNKILESNVSPTHARFNANNSDLGDYWPEIGRAHV